MDWASAIPPLAGTVIGGAITIAGQARADRRREDATVLAETREEFRGRLARSRDAVRELHDRVSEDIAVLRGAVMLTDDAANVERAQLLQPVFHDVAARHDRAASLIAVVPAVKVRDAADKVYTDFGEWIYAEMTALVDGYDNPVDADGVRKSRTTFSAAVRKHLQDLDDEESAGPKQP